jgi:2-dehydro-3-deoxyphosphooctonate aldolase (KDO 8-P synthase)
MREVLIRKDFYVGNNNPLFLIAGPCVIESEKLAFSLCEKIKNICDKLNIPFVFKSSFDKANRSSIDSYRGPGIIKGLEILNKIKETYKVPILTDIHLPEQALQASEVVDIIQIPAFLCRQTDIVVAAAKTGKAVNIKKGQFLAPWDIKNIIKKVEYFGNHNIILCERGTSFGYNNLVVDMTSLIEMKKTNYPVIFDGTHSVQKPGGLGKKSGGNREYVEYLSRAATAIGIDGIFLEVHENPDEAKSDAANQIQIDSLEKILMKLLEIDKIIK